MSIVFSNEAWSEALEALWTYHFASTLIGAPYALQGEVVINVHNRVLLSQRNYHIRVVPSEDKEEMKEYQGVHVTYWNIIICMKGLDKRELGSPNIKRKWHHILTSRWVENLEILLYLSMTPRTYLDLPPLSQDSIDKFSSSNDIYADAKITKLSRGCVVTYLVK